MNSTIVLFISERTVVYPNDLHMTPYSVRGPPAQCNSLTLLGLARSGKSESLPLTAHSSNFAQTCRRIRRVFQWKRKYCCNSKRSRLDCPSPLCISCMPSSCILARKYVATLATAPTSRKNAGPFYHKQYTDSVQYTDSLDLSGLKAHHHNSSDTAYVRGA